jgi:uncharacterized protein (TIGR00725 family)
MERKAVIGVMGGSKATAADCEAARQLGRLIAQRGWILLNGGRNTGIMAATSAGAREAIDDGADGFVVGILPDPTANRAAPDLDLAIVTDMGDARNVINILSSDVVIACPGALGTLSEIVLAIKREKPLILLGCDVDDEVARHAKRGRLARAETPAAAITLADKWITDGRW